MGIAFDYVPGHFRFLVDGKERILPALDGELLGRWHARYASDFIGGVEMMTEAVESGDLPQVIAVGNLANDSMVDALMAYDITGALGDREWIRATLTAEQLYLILRRIQRAHA